MANGTTATTAAREWPCYDAMVFLGGIHGGGRVEVRNGTEVWLVIPGKNHERLIPPAALDELESRGWIVIGDTVEVTDAGRYWGDRWVRQVARQFGLGKMRLVRAGGLR